ncbi:hypothetical protein [Lachnoclostridium sp.]|uniref:hypothetical protein n=1 Tax=Lachnoclostridium sp. TaxID=2028282 RepID=UPI00269B1C0B|nr:hypothetical protein [Lachnoclostridium sp.]
MTKNPNHSFQKKEQPHSPSKGVVTEKTEKDAQTGSTSNTTKNKTAKTQNKEY